MTAYPELYMIIDGERIHKGSRRTHRVINPATEETLGELPLADAADLDRALETAQKGFKIWRNSTPQERAAVLQARYLDPFLDQPEDQLPPPLRNARKAVEQRLGIRSD